MHIHVVSGKGTGRTMISAFDTALKDTGVYNYNLLYLSSVIPPEATIVEEQQYTMPTNEYGDRLYVVAAEMRSSKQDEAVGAGIGWYQYGDDQRGLFVEHELTAVSETEATEALKTLITHSLEDLCASRGIPFDATKMGMKIEVTTVLEEPTCALVLAVYESQPWNA